VALFTVPDTVLNAVCSFLLVIVSFLLLFFLLLFDHCSSFLLLSELTLLFFKFFIHEGLEAFGLSVKPFSCRSLPWCKPVSDFNHIILMSLFIIIEELHTSHISASSIDNLCLEVSIILHFVVS